MRAQLDRALATASRNLDDPYRLVDDQCEIRVPLPAGLIDGLEALDVTVRYADAGAAPVISFISPLAALDEEPDDGAAGGFAMTLLRRQFFPTQTEGASFAIADREDVLVAIHHWLPAEVTDDEFARMFSRFVSAALLLRGEVVTAAEQGAPITPFTTD